MVFILFEQFMILFVSNAAELDVSNRDCATPYQEDTWYLTSHLVGLFLEKLQEVKLWSPNDRLHNDAHATQTHDLVPDTLCQTMSYTTSQNQLVMRKADSNLLWHSTLRPMSLFLEQLQGFELWSPQQDDCDKRWVRISLSN